MNFYRAVLFSAAVISVAACGPTGKKVTDHSFTSNLDGLVLDKSQAPTLV
jgi:hypothetical protein